MVITVTSEAIILNPGRFSQSQHPRGSLRFVFKTLQDFTVTGLNSEYIADSSLSSTKINNVAPSGVSDFFALLATSGAFTADTTTSVTFPSPVVVSATDNIPTKLNSFSSELTGVFGGLVTSQPTLLFSNSYREDKGEDLFEEIITGTATSILNTPEAAVRMTVSAPGDSVIRQSREYIRYQPGRGQQLTTTFQLPADTTNVAIRRGLFDSSANKSIGITAGNGIYLQAINGVVSFGIRKNNVDDVIPQSAWNIDRFDGAGPSGLVIDWANTQIFRCDYEWLGAGEVRFGFKIGDNLYFAHKEFHSNLISATYMATGSLPFRTEIFGLPGLAAPVTMLDICSEVSSQGGEALIGRKRTVVRDTATAQVGATARYPLLSVRTKANYNRIPLRPISCSAHTTSGSSFRLEIWLNGTLTGANFIASSTGQAFEVDTAATAINTTNARLLWAIDVATQLSRGLVEVIGDLTEAYASIAGVSDVLTLAIFRTETTGTDAFWGTLNFAEMR